MNRLSDKSALITGAASGIGRAAAELFAREGAKVVVADVSSGGEDVARAIRENGGEAIFIRTDVSRADDVEECVRAAVDRFGHLTTVYNNAAAVSLAVHDDRPVTELSEEVWDRIIAVTLKSVFLCCKSAIPELIRAGGGSVINTGSTDAVIAQPGFDSYTAAKGGVLALTRSMAAEYARFGVRVNAIVPAFVRTAATEPELANDEARHAAEGLHLTRLGEAEDIARFALYLASDDSEYVTGGWHFIDGGYSAFKTKPGSSS